MPKQENVELTWKSNCLLGESPIWCDNTQSLFFIDIVGKKILRWKDSHKKDFYTTSKEPGSIVLSNQSGTILCAMEHELCSVYLNKDNFSYKTHFIFNELKENRMNDGKCDPAGRFWVASMNKTCQDNSGKVWRINRDFSCKEMIGGFSVGNGFGWNPEGTIMYFTDSEKRVIYSYMYDLSTGDLGARSVFAKIPIILGKPDGLAVDSDGFVWSAHWDGWRVTRYQPDGKIDRVIKMPVPRPTSIAFGGKDLDILFITSASVGLRKKDITNAPLSGSLFSLKLDTAGLRSYSFGEEG
jgi:sugar lactone lactonase YvrE